MIKKIPQYAKDPADDPGFKTEQLARKETVIQDGERIAMLTPLEEWENFMDFDRNAAKLGHHQFIRPVMKSDGLPKHFDATHVIVNGDERARFREFVKR